MANYSITNSTVASVGSSQQTITTTYKTICAVAASTISNNTSGNLGLRRGKVYDILVGTDAAPGDTYIEYDVARATILTAANTWAGSLSSFSSAIALDPADGPCNGMIFANSSAETNVAQVGPDIWYVGVNQRASYRWVAAPGSELVHPAVSSGTGSNGLALRARGSYTGTVTGNILWQEQ
jgi:hypothetical protein